MGEIGRVVLVIPASECANWQPLDAANVGRFARSIGCDTIAPQHSSEPSQAERDAVLAVGCAYTTALGEPLLSLADEVQHLLQQVGEAKDLEVPTIWLDGLTQARENPPLVHQLTSIFGSTEPVAPPPPAPVGWQQYIVQAEETIQEITEYLKLGSWFSDMYQPNMEEIEATARAHGKPNSEMGSYLYPGQVLKYRR